MNLLVYNYTFAPHLFANRAILHPLFFLWAILHPHLLPPFPSFNEDFEQKHNWQKIGCKITKKKRGGAKSFNWQKIERKSAIKPIIKTSPAQEVLNGNDPNGHDMTKDGNENHRKSQQAHNHSQVHLLRGKC